MVGLVGQSPAPVLPPLPGQGLFSLETPHFQIVGTNYPATQYLQAMCTSATQVMGRHMTMPREFRRPILVQLIPAEQADFNNDFRIEQNQSGDVMLSFRWSPDITFSTVCRGLMLATLRQTFFFGTGTRLPADTPEWLPLMLGIELEIALKPPLRQYYARLALEEDSFLPIDVVFNYRRATGEFADLLALNGYWLWQFLTAETGRGRPADTLFRAFLTNPDNVAVLRRLFPETFTESRVLSLWWSVGYQFVARNVLSGVQTMAESRNELLPLGYVTVVIDDTERRLGGLEIAPYRDNPAVIAALNVNMTVITSMLGRLNAVYYNTYLALGEYYEALLAGQEGREAYIAFIDEFQSAREIENAVNAVMAR